MARFAPQSRRLATSTPQIPLNHGDAFCHGRLGEALGALRPTGDSTIRLRWNYVTVLAWLAITLMLLIVGRFVSDDGEIARLTTELEGLANRLHDNTTLSRMDSVRFCCSRALRVLAPEETHPLLLLVCSVT